MFERFTDRARRVLVLSQGEARLLNHDFIGTEHILLGLIHEGEGVAAKALGSLGIRLDRVREQVEGTIGPAGSSTTGSPPFTPRAKKVLELSLREALQLGHDYIGTEHMLLGLLSEGEGVGAQVLVSLGADLSRIRERVIELLSGYQPSAGAEDAPRAWVSRPPSGRVRLSAPWVARTPREPSELLDPVCQDCGANLTTATRYRLVAVAHGVEGETAPELLVALVYCGACGRTLGSHDPPAASPAGDEGAPPEAEAVPTDDEEAAPPSDDAAAPPDEDATAT